jgi:hypothetical protein
MEAKAAPRKQSTCEAEASNRGTNSGQNTSDSICDLRRIVTIGSADELRFAQLVTRQSMDKEEDVVHADRKDEKGNDFDNQQSNSAAAQRPRADGRRH